MLVFDDVKADYADFDHAKATDRGTGVWQNGCPGRRSSVNVAEWRACGLTSAGRVMTMLIIGSAITTGWGRSADILRKQAFLATRTDAMGKGASFVSGRSHGIVQRAAMDTRDARPDSSLLRQERNGGLVVNSVFKGD